MEIKKIELGHIHSNCYLLSTEKTAIVIDPGFNSFDVTDFLAKNNHKERLILLTHCHFDHIGGANNLRKNTDTKIAIGQYDANALLDTSKNLSDKFHAKLEPFSADILLKDNEEIKIGDITVKVFETPGHTPGGVCYLVDDILFSGDTLFCESIGRTDFFDGNFSDLEKSIKRLYTLPQDTIVLSGHGEKTTILHEKTCNPFIRG